MIIFAKGSLQAAVEDLSEWTYDIDILQSPGWTHQYNVSLQVENSDNGNSGSGRD